MKFPRARKWVLRVVRVAVLIYLILAIAVMSFQKWFIFPGTNTQGIPDARLHGGPGTEVLALKTADGTPIAALFGTATTGDSLTAPTVIFFYGNAMCAAYSTDIFDHFRRLGANVIVPDYPGFGMSGGSASETGCYQAADAAYDYLLSRSDIDHDKIVSVGLSLGTGVAVDLASRKKVAGLILFSPYTRIADVGHGLFPWLPVSIMIHHRFDNLKKMPSIACPILMMHGEIDDLVPAKMSLRLNDAAGGRAKRIVFPGAGHNDLFDVGAEKLWDEVGDFLKSLGKG